MRLVGELWLWRDDGHLVARLRTNAPKALIEKRLREAGLGEGLEDITIIDDPLRLNGGASGAMQMAGRRQRGASRRAAGPAVKTPGFP
jgi:hypothetical protein